MADPVIVCPSCGAKNRVPVAATGHPVCAKCRTELPWLVDAGDADFEAATGTGQLVLVDLWAPWCGPCRMVAPVLANLAVEFAGRMKVVKVNVDEAPKTAARYEARSIPMLLFIRAGEVVESVVGAQPEHVLRSRIQQYV
ncbi:MAG TPA: thioredoxin [Ilumatobacteraceae bacterium]|nr:thioredoxin [Ilumatobacteraceae bacterium]HRB01805.1 thioredoxin [Ilumatobacteraceae bacterium]